MRPTLLLKRQRDGDVSSGANQYPENTSDGFSVLFLKFAGIAVQTRSAVSASRLALFVSRSMALCAAFDANNFSLTPGISQCQITLLNSLICLRSSSLSIASTSASVWSSARVLTRGFV